MRADCECPVDLGDLHIRFHHEFITADEQSVASKKSTSKPIPISAIKPQNSSLVLLQNHVENSMSLPFSDDLWCSSSTMGTEFLPLLHDELIHQSTDTVFRNDFSDYPEFQMQNLNDHSSIQTSAHASPDASRPCTPVGSASPSLSPLRFLRSGSLSTSPDLPSTLSTCHRKRSAHQADRRGSTDSGSEKKEQKVPRHKRPAHIRAETKRRGKIQDCLNHLTELVPMVVDNESKISGGLSRKTKAAVLNQTADYCRRLCAENKSLQSEADALRAEMQALTADINTFQRLLPPEGIDNKALKKTSSIDDMFRNYLNARSLANWKFWIFGQFIRPLFTTFAHGVSTSSLDEFFRTVFLWVNDHLSLISLRPAIFTALLEIFKNPTVVKDGQLMPQEISAVVLTDTGLVPSRRASVASNSSR